MNYKLAINIRYKQTVRIWVETLPDIRIFTYFVHFLNEGDHCLEAVFIKENSQVDLSVKAQLFADAVAIGADGKRGDL